MLYWKSDFIETYWIVNTEKTIWAGIKFMSGSRQYRWLWGISPFSLLVAPHHVLLSVSSCSVKWMMPRTWLLLTFHQIILIIILDPWNRMIWKPNLIEGKNKTFSFEANINFQSFPFVLLSTFLSHSIGSGKMNGKMYFASTTFQIKYTKCSQFLYIRCIQTKKKYEKKKN